MATETVKTVELLTEMATLRTRINELLHFVVSIIIPLNGVGSEQMQWAIKYCMFADAPHAPNRMRPLLVLMVIKALGVRVKQSLRNCGVHCGVGAHSISDS